MLKMLIVVLFLTGCWSVAECDPGDARCDGDAVEVCDADGYWDISVDCNAGSWACCIYGGEVGCCPRVFCEVYKDGGE